jgi:ABC-type multidrug transport system fused ATPase/permease subunit
MGRRRFPALDTTCADVIVSSGVLLPTGSGKSSLMLSLFRLIDINIGSIVLDGVDTASIALDSLRKQLAIIPQVSALFMVLFMVLSMVLQTI